MDVDTIVALSTAPGVGALAVVRLSGPEAFSVLREVAPELEEGGPPPRVATVTRLRSQEDGAMLDQAMVTRFPGPDSYTGEDLVEISCHGGWLVPQLVLEACLQHGARQAEPGEFTRRAYLRGRMDLVQAEAVADVIHARSRALHRIAVAQLDRGLSERVGELRRAVVELEALLAHHIDFPEEDEPPVPLDRIRERAGGLVARLDGMLATAPEGELLREGALVVLAGRPNAGKSSLYNALLGTERAIVTEEAGTTRDALEATLELGGFPFRLVDTAGLRETERHIERLGIEVTRRYLREADVILLCVEADREMVGGERVFLQEIEERPVVVVETKADLARAAGGRGSPDASELEERIAARVRVSARTGEGLDRLRSILPRLVYAGLVTASREAPVLTRRRHVRAMRAARDGVEGFARALDRGVPPEVAAADLKAVDTALEELLGVISVDDVLDVVFREFCVGK